MPYQEGEVKGRMICRSPQLGNPSLESQECRKSQGSNPETESFNAFYPLILLPRKLGSLTGLCQRRVILIGTLSGLHVLAVTASIP